MRYKYSGKVVTEQGTITPDFLLSLQPSQDPLQQLSIQNYQALVQVQVILPTSQLITFSRGSTSLNFTTSQVFMNPGDVLQLSAIQLLNIIPL